MAYQVTTLRTVLGTQEKITTSYATLALATAAANAVAHTAIVKDASNGAFVSHHVAGTKTSATHF